MSMTVSSDRPENREPDYQMMSWLYYVGHWGVSLFLFLFTRFRVKGRNNVPRKGPVLVTSNHLSLMDPPVVGVSMGRTIIFMAKEELFSSKFSGYFIRRFGAFPVHRGRFDREAIRQAEQTLAKNRMLVMFPEGHRRGQEGYTPEGYVGAALGAGPFSPTINSPALIEIVLCSIRYWKARARRTGMDFVPWFD